MRDRVVRFPPVRFRGQRVLFERCRRPLWRWSVWIVYPGGSEYLCTRSGFWTRFGAASFAAEAQVVSWAAGYRNRWAYEVRRIVK